MAMSKQKMASTVAIPGRCTRSPMERVIGLLAVDTGETFHFADLVNSQAPVHWFIIGRDPSSDIVIAAETVTRSHCFIQWDDTQTLVRDYDSKNKTLVNGVPLHDGHAELLPGFILELGHAALMACGVEVGTTPHILAKNKYSFARKANRYYPSPRKAAVGTKISRSTLTRWVEIGELKVPTR